MRLQYFHCLFLLCVKWHLITSSFVFKHHASLDPDGNYKMAWLIQNDTIVIKVTVKTTGWIGWGTSQNGFMRGADMVIGWLDKTGKSFFTDRHGLGNFQPIVDKIQDYTLHEMTQQNGTTAMTFSRKLKLCSDEDNIINQDTMRVLYAWNNKDPVDNKYLEKHTARGSRSLLLLGSSDATMKTTPQSEKNFDLAMKDQKLPTITTSYKCKAFELPKMTGKQHLIRVETLISPGNENYVHHLLVYICSSADNRTLGVQHECREDNMPGLECDNANMIHAWAIGGTNFYYPENVGLPLNYANSPRYLLLEIHYDNPDHKQGLIDNSGLRLVYTDQLRKYDARVLQMGTSPGSSRAQLIPQGQKNFTTYAFCHSSCLNVTESKKYYIFASFLHAHTVGQKIIARLIRDADNTEVRKISFDNNYDFNYQEVRVLNNPMEIPAGHSIHLDCNYNTENRANPTIGGLGSNEEMCLVYLFIYPKLNLKSCYSDVMNVRAFGINEGFWPGDKNRRINATYVVNGKEFKNFRLYRAFQEKEFWMGRQGIVKQFEHAGLSYPYARQCYYENGPDNLVFKYIPVTKNAERKLLSDDVCVAETTQAPVSTLPSSTQPSTTPSKASTNNVLCALIVCIAAATMQLIR